MMRKFLWLSLALMAASPARADITSWADLRDRVDGRGEQIVRRLALHRNEIYSDLRLLPNATQGYNVREDLRKIGSPTPDGGQLYKVELTHPVPGSQDNTVEHVFQTVDADDRIIFWPTRFSDDIPEQNRLQFYIYVANAVLDKPEDNLLIEYARGKGRDHTTNFNGSAGGLIYPGCYTFKTRISANDHITPTDPRQMGTCPLPTFPEPSPDLAAWIPQDDLVGPGWLHATLREGQNEFEGLILVIQPADARLGLSTAASCEATDQACIIDRMVESVVEEAITGSLPATLPPPPARAPASSGSYLALLVAPSGAESATGSTMFSGVTAGARISFSSPESGIEATGLFREISAAGQTDLSLFALTLEPEIATAFAAGAREFTLPLEWPTASGLCQGEVTFSRDFTALPAPRSLNCAAQPSTTVTVETLPSLPEAVQNTLILRTRLDGVTAKASPFNTITGPCQTPPEFIADAETKVYCVSGSVEDSIISFTYSIARLDTTEFPSALVFASPGGSALVAVSGVSHAYQLGVAPEWSFFNDDILRFDLAFPEIGLAQAFVDTLDIRITRVSDGEVELEGITPELVLGENVVRLTLPKHVDETALLQPDDAVYQVRVETSAGALTPVSRAAGTPAPDFPEESGSLFYLDLNDFLSVKPLVVSFAVEAQTYAWANDSTRVWASLPGTQNAPYICELALRVDGRDYVLIADTDRASYTFPYDFPEVAADDVLGIVARPRDYISDPREAELAAKLCPTTATLMSEISAEVIQNNRTIPVPLGQPVLSYFLRSGTSEDKYGTRNEHDIFHVGFAPALALEESRVVARYLPQRGGGGARSFRLVSRFSTSDPLVENVTAGRVSDKLSEMLRVGYLPDGDISVKAALQDAIRAREDFGLTGAFWPDVVIQASGDRLMTCATLERAMAELELDFGDQVSGVGSENAKLAVIYDSYSNLESGALYESERCTLENSFGEVLLFKTSLDNLFRSGGRRYDKAAEIQAEWAAALGDLFSLTVEQ